MGKMFHLRVVKWLAANDEPENLDAGYMADSMLVGMGAALLKQQPAALAADVIEYRKNPPAPRLVGVATGVGRFDLRRRIPEGYINTDDAAKRIGISVFSLRQLIREGSGPDGIKHSAMPGSINKMTIFKPDDVDRWASEHADWLSWHRNRWQRMSYQGADKPQPHKQGE